MGIYVLLKKKTGHYVKSFYFFFSRKLIVGEMAHLIFSKIFGFLSVLLKGTISTRACKQDD